jgi:hypothetical protein
MQFSEIPNTVEAIEEWLRGTKVYPRSIQQAGGEVLCAVKDAHQHYLLAIFNPRMPPFLRDSFSGETQDLTETLAYKWCFPSHSNARKLRALFPWTAPQSLGEAPTFAVRDLIGLAAPAILQAHSENYAFALTFEAAPGELGRLSRTMDEALDAVTFAVFQENYRHPWAMRAVQVADENEAKIYRKLGYIAVSYDEPSGESAAWIEAARQTIAQKAPDLLNEIGGIDFFDCWTAKNQAGAWRFRDRVYRLLLDHETEHFALIKAAAERLLDDFRRTLKKG